ncbi:MAG: hypothetical protein RLZZ187_589 [Pseudomonadota bacterium]|jgi:hypothetical protein
MWLMTDIGFFSIVEKPADKGSGLLTIRSRMRSDLEAFGQRCRFSGGITAEAGTDYPYRAAARKADVAAALAQLAADIDYPNFKDRVKTVQGSARAAAYGDVWSVLYDLEKNEQKARKKAAPKA